MIPALVLTAGLGTRLRPLSRVRAKAALPVAGGTLIRRILGRLADAGIRDVVLNLHHLPETITAQAGDGGDLGLRLRYSWEVPILGSAGGPRLALTLLDAPTWLIVNGDTLTDVPIAAVLEAHRRSGALVTMALVPNPAPEKYGGVVVDDAGVVTGFTRRGSATPSHHFIGVQAVEAGAFASVPLRRPFESVGALYPELMRARPGSVRALVCSAQFLDIGTPRDYVETCRQVAAREGFVLEGGNIVWDDVRIDPGATLRGCVVADGARVPPGTWTDVILRPAGGELDPFERVEGQLAISPLDPR